MAIPSQRSASVGLNGNNHKPMPWPCSQQTDSTEPAQPGGQP